LLDPEGYCRRLREKSPRPFYLVVEKILARHERLREDWPIEGTTGYEFANLVGALFVDPAGEEPFSRIYGGFTGRTEPFEDMVRACTIRIMETEMASELNILAREAGRIARSNPRTSDFTLNILHQALKEVVARFPVYRTYVGDDGADEVDRRDIDWAVAQARRTEGAPDPSVFDFVHRLLTGDLVAEAGSGYSRHQVLRFAMKLQQYSGPVMAKGLEDTAFYRYNRLAALNEVGGHPDHFGVSVAAFHHTNQERARRWPHAMLGTSTHDTKRGEDTRARLYALSEMPDEWERQLTTWSRILRARLGDIEGTAPPKRNDEYLLYQLLLGAWPAELTDADPDQLDPGVIAGFRERIEGAMLKSIREAKEHSTWASPNQAYEDAVNAFVRECLDLSRRNAFLESFLPFQARLARLGVVNGLAQTLVKLTTPGVPDIYQGAELWDLSLVDPDNRRPVDYAARRRLLDDVDGLLERDPGAVSGLMERWQDGAVKLALIRQALKLRSRKPGLFANGDYEPLEVRGEFAQHVCAYARTLGDDAAVVAVPRLLVALGAEPDWRDTVVPLPASRPAAGWRNVLTGAVVETSGDAQAAAFPAAALFGTFPVALLVPEA
ncbi:MAG TPA: malto-oligosyltrehalose synthase, partial [Arenibaculum sp.]|nr:malto-oligosyltrehalose synthase [Arenibaculum sp.]